MRAPNAMQNHGEDGLAVLAFKVRARQFDLNRDLKFISMKDQLIRGRTLVLAAYQAGLIGPDKVAEEDRANIIVIGAGVGGVSAALMACQLGLTVKLVEAAEDCFPLLGNGSDRLFSATVYDWPHAHSGCNLFPYIETIRDLESVEDLRKNSMTLRFPADAVDGNELRSKFIEQLKGYRQKCGSDLEIMCQHRLDSMDDIGVNDASKLIFVDIQSPTGVRRLRGQIVIFALGFGLDKNNQQTKAAAKFFSYKGLREDIQKAQNNPDGGLVKIIGAGDGGLQEALRFVLSDGFQDFYKCVNRLEKILEEVRLAAFWSKLCNRLQSAEDQAARSLMWGYAEEHIYKELDAVYQREVKALLDLAPDSVAMWRREVVRRGNFRVQLVDSSPYSMKSYALNRWLVLLLQDVPSTGEGQVILERITREDTSEKFDVYLERKGFAAVDKQSQIGTANQVDLLRRIAFQSIPMNLDAIV